MASARGEGHAADAGRRRAGWGNGAPRWFELHQVQQLIDAGALISDAEGLVSFGRTLRPKATFSVTVMWRKRA